MKKVAVIMGSDSDFPIVSKAVAELKAYGVPYECHVMSAHRTPSAACDFASSAKDEGFGVIICAAGMAAPGRDTVKGRIVIRHIDVHIPSPHRDPHDTMLCGITRGTLLKRSTAFSARLPFP